MADRMRSMMGDGGMAFSAWPMMVFMGLFWILAVILMALAIIWLIKNIKK